MSSFFKNTDLDLHKAEKIVSETLNKCDDGELYLEDTKSESIVLDDNKIKSSNYTKDSGYGFRAINDTVKGFMLGNVTASLPSASHKTQHIDINNNFSTTTYLDSLVLTKRPFVTF